MKNAPATAAARPTRLTLVPPLNRMEIRLPDDPFLLTRFEEFYQEVVWLKSQCAGHAPPSAQDAHGVLVAFLMKQEHEVDRFGTLLGIEMYRQAQRVMACLADEIFCACSWPQGEKWQPVESELFETDRPGGLKPGGQALRKLDQLLRQDDPVYRELASIYFYALALAKPSLPETEDYLAALSKMVFEPAGSPLLFAQGYAHTLSENKVTLLPSPKKWLWVLGGIFFLWFALSWVLWVQVSTPVENQIHAIKEMLRP